MLRKSSELSIKEFYCVFVRTEINLIAFSGPRNCINTQYAALSGAMPCLKQTNLDYPNGERKRMPMVYYAWLNVDFENILGENYLQQQLKLKETTN